MRRPETGWGEKLSNYFKKGVTISNHARNGRSTKSFIAEGRWQTVLDSLQKGDYVFIQFGHNDSKEDTARFSSPVDYGKNLERFVRETQQKEAFPILLTPIVRRRFDEKGAFYDTHGEYPDAVRILAKSQNIPLIDLHQKSEALLVESGEEASESLFLWLEKGENPNYPDGVSDNTHLSPKGAEKIAGLAVSGIEELDVPLKKHLQD